MADRYDKSLKKQSKQEEPLRFKWNEEMVQKLLNALYEYKCVMEYNNSDFNADKPNSTKL